MSVAKAAAAATEEDYAKSRMLEDLQLAAELGKTLLERNKELEAAVKQLQVIHDDQVQEIEYLQKQSTALKEVNDSRLRVYEQLEVSIQELERANHRLGVENAAQRRQIRGLNTTIEGLEARCEDLQATVDELKLQVEVLRKRKQRASDASSHQFPTASVREVVTLRHVDKHDEERPISPDSSGTKSEETKCASKTPSKTKSSPKATTPVKVDGPPTPVTSESKESQNMEDLHQLSEYLEADSGFEQMSQLLAQLRESRVQCSRFERKIVDLEEQLSASVQQNRALEDQVIRLAHKEEDIYAKSMHEELTTLEEVRQGQMCSRCLRSMNQNGSDVPEDDDASMLEELMAASQHHSSFSMDVQPSAEAQSTPNQSKQSANPYKELVEKYEALVEVHRIPTRPNKEPNLQEEIHISGEFNLGGHISKDTDEESGHGDSLKTEKDHKKSMRTFSTPTDFSEAETSSSGFADETSNKGTQTEGRVGSFLCTIADGEDCKFSIYDDASPIDSRFRDRPEYRVLFKEIFKVLKKAAENKEEGEDLPLLDDCTPVKQTLPDVPPATPSNDQLPEFPDDDSQSVISSTMSELSVSQIEPTTVVENIIESQNQPIPEPEPSQDGKPECLLRPLVREPLEYVSVEVRKRSSSRRKSKYADRSDSPVTHIIGSPKIHYSSRPNSGRRRRELRNQPPAEPVVENPPWNGTTLHFWSSRNLASPTPSQGSGKAVFEFKPSSASHDLHKLKKLDMSYAEVLRNADTKKKELMRYRRK